MDRSWESRLCCHLSAREEKEKRRERDQFSADKVSIENLEKTATHVSEILQEAVSLLVLMLLTFLVLRRREGEVLEDKIVVSFDRNSRSFPRIDSVSRLTSTLRSALVR